ncbi:hypothetical protein SPSYN_01975 [Sporotomaculum syntrophicum]|uniref:Uncharacterized protein n=1 Tax=Sporotomaculum syntrophicum TaxID=182264 RepID=A0A9D3AW04_9FIRM|nr:hypothetical protein SPSYN_01975 [Sporotomaculum syntrophicum]
MIKNTILEVKLMVHKKKYGEEFIPRPDTKYGPGLDNLNTAQGEETDPLAAFNAEKESGD